MPQGRGAGKAQRYKRRKPGHLRERPQKMGTVKGDIGGGLGKTGGSDGCGKHGRGAA